MDLFCKSIAFCVTFRLIWRSGGSVRTTPLWLDLDLVLDGNFEQFHLKGITSNLHNGVEIEVSFKRNAGGVVVHRDFAAVVRCFHCAYMASYSGEEGNQLRDSMSLFAMKPL